MKNLQTLINELESAKVNIDLDDNSEEATTRVNKYMGILDDIYKTVKN